VSADIVNELVERRIGECDCAPGFVLDGYPRDLGQAVKFNQLLRTSDRLIVIDINADLERVLPRLTGRRTCTSCNAIYHLLTSPPRRDGFCDVCDTALMQRSDDREDVIRERFKIYQRLAVPLQRLYRRQGVYHQIDGLRSRDHVNRNIRRLLARVIQPSQVIFGVA
jgi:adenylate kinase